MEGRTPVLKKSRWLLLKREENLKTEQRFRLRDILRYNLRTVRAYLLKETFQRLWDYNSATWAGKFLDGGAMIDLGTPLATSPALPVASTAAGRSWGIPPLPVCVHTAPGGRKRQWSGNGLQSADCSVCARLIC